ncbi:MAG: TatD family hydrolase [Bacteroides sp.]|nr:TatD family hydrolase [Bacteroides sp.]
MTDTHTHLYMEDYAGEERDVVERALRAGVSLMVLPGVNMDSIGPILRMHEAFPEVTVPALGLHPTDVDANWSEILDRMEALLADGVWKAIGEVGIDLYHDSTYRAEQKEAFRRQIEWAVERDLPLIIHCREGLDDCLEVLASFEGRLPRMVFHSFTGNVADVRRIRRVCDPWFGINGVVTFKNAPLLREALPEIGLERILLETDAPWLAPVPNRGKRNESSYIPAIAACVASTLDLPLDEVEQVTDANARRFLFNHA